MNVKYLVVLIFLCLGVRAKPADLRDKLFEAVQNGNVTKKNTRVEMIEKIN